MKNLRENVKVIEENENFLVVYKPSYLPTVPLKNDNKLTLLQIVSECYENVVSFNGYSAWENGVLHRLDTNTSGLVLIARNKDSFDYLLDLQKTGRFKKEYRAISNKNSKRIDAFGEYPYGDPLLCNKPVDIESCFRYFGKGRKMVLPVLDSYSKFLVNKSTGVSYKTSVSFYNELDDEFEFKCTLTSGFKHQVRSHMAWCGYPLLGDESYGGIKSDKFGLEAIGINFLDPKTDKEITIKYLEK